MSHFVLFDPRDELFCRILSPKPVPPNFSIMPHRLTTEIDRLFPIVQGNAFETSLPYHSEVEHLAVVLGMIYHQVPSFPRLECGYIPFQPENESAVLVILDRLDSLVIPRKRSLKVLYPEHTSLVFPMNSAEQLHQINEDLASILLDERMIGYIKVALSRLRRMSKWVKSSYYSKSWKELDTVLRGLSPDTALLDILSMISEKSGWQVSTIQSWIHLAATSYVFDAEPYIISAIDERNMDCLACRVSTDETALDYIKKFYNEAKLSVYILAFQEFRDLWFEGKIYWESYSLTSDASDWLAWHTEKKSTGKCVHLKQKSFMDRLFIFKTHEEEMLEILLGRELYPSIVI